MKTKKSFFWIGLKGFTTLVALVFALNINVLSQNIAITDEDGYSPDATAMLDVYSINKGMLVPRVALVSTESPISGTKPEGLLVWNTSTTGSYPDLGFYFWSGFDWEKVGSSALDFQNGLTKTGNIVSHEDLSSQSSVNNSGGTVIQDVTLGSLGHVTGLTSYNLDNRYYTESEVNTLISGENIWDRSSNKIYPHTISDDVGIGTSNPQHRLHIIDNVSNTTGIDGNFINIQNSNITSGVMSGIRFSNGYTSNYFKGGIFYHDVLSYGRGDIVFANRSAIGSSNVTLSDARMIIRNNGNVGIGTPAPLSRLEVQGNSSGSDEDPLFDVKNNNGQTVFAVYPDGVRIYVADYPGKGSKGGFAVGGFSASKGLTNEYFRVTPDSVRIYIEEGSKGAKGGFAVGGFSAKGASIDLLHLTKENYFIGHNSGTNTTGAYNSFIGYESGMSNKDGSKNVFIGYLSGTLNESGENNVFIGNETGKSNNGGSHNAFLGYRTGYNNTGGNFNTFFGYEAGYNSGGSSYNTAMGYQSGYSLSSWQGGVYVGYLAGKENTGRGNTMIGAHAGENATTGEYNVFIGSQAGWRTDGQVSTGSRNVFIGRHAGWAFSGGNNNVHIGFRAGEGGSGSDNVFIGSNAGFGQTGSNKLFIENSNSSTPLIYGEFDGDGLVAINGDFNMGGTRMLITNSPGTGTDPAYYISQGVVNSTNNKQYAVAIYDPLWVTGNVYCDGVWVSSDKRYKNNIQTINNALNKIKEIKGVSFEFNKKVLAKDAEAEALTGKASNTTKQLGFIAQDIEKILPEVVHTDENGFKSVDYSKVSAVLVEAIKEQQKIIEELQQRIEKLEKPQE